VLIASSNVYALRSRAAIRARDRRRFAFAVRGVIVSAVWLLSLASLAHAGPPTHLHNEALDISGFNHACGTAVDSEGDVYVSSAGESKVRVFDPSHVELGSISNPNEPCGLAVNSKGGVFVSEKATGKVVRYKPNAYPFSGSLSYGSAEPIDSSGSAKGIFVDPIDDRLYVAEGGRVSVYDSTGKLGIDEVQRIRCFECTGGKYKLSFGGEKTVPIDFEGPASEVKTALEGLATIGAGNVSVEKDGLEHFVTFVGKFSDIDIETLSSDTAELIGELGKKVITEERTKGWSGHIGEGELTEATGVAAYTYKVNSERSNRYVFIADAATDRVKVFSGEDIRTLKLRKEIAGPGVGEDFDFGSAGAYLAVDPGNGASATQKCESPVGGQACTAGHFFVYDDAHKMVDEFEASGAFLDQFTDPVLAGAAPTALAVDRSGGPHDGTVYVTTGAGPGAKLLAFGPLSAPSRPPLPDLSRELETARAVATDAAGDVYVAAGSFVHVYRPNGTEVKVGPTGKGFETSEPAWDLAADSTGKVYTMIGKNNGNRELEKVQYYTPAIYPPQDGAQYGGATTVATAKSFPTPTSPLSAIGINPVNNRVFITNGGPPIELGSAAEGSPILNSCFGCTLGIVAAVDIAAYGENGDVYISQNSRPILVIEPSGTEVVARLTGVGSPKGAPLPPNPQIAVDQSNGHVVTFDNSRGAAEEYEATGAFVAEIAFPEPKNFSTSPSRDSGLAIDNSGGAGDGNLYVAFDDPKPNTFDLWAFGAVSYGEPPIAVTGVADGVGGGSATLHGTVDPRGFELSGCTFEYLTDTAYHENVDNEVPPFSGAASSNCAESFVEIGDKTGAVPVHADVTGLNAEARYRFRLVATNKYGQGVGGTGLFGPPIVETRTASPVLYTEATLRARIDPSGLATTYHFEYGEHDSEYDRSTPAVQLPPGDGPVAVQAELTGLSESKTYHFRIIAENEAGPAPGDDRAFTTLTRRPDESCSNAEYRTGLSANLPDCRAYELVTPAESRGMIPHAGLQGSAEQWTNNWLVAPRGSGAGESVAFFVEGTLPGFDGTGRSDGYRARRAAGAHPSGGWGAELYGPSFTEVGGGFAHNVSPDQENWIWGNDLRVSGVPNPECNPEGWSHFELVGCGDLGTDPSAEGRFVSAGGMHLVFFSKKHLEEGAAPEGTISIYDRPVGASSAEVVSVKPDGTSFGAGENANYLGASEDGSAVAFKVGSTLYLHRGGETTEVAEGPNHFAGISTSGRRIFFIDENFSDLNAPAANLYLCDIDAGPCLGSADPPGLTRIATTAIFVNVSPDGSRVLFSSESALPGLEPNEQGETAKPGKHNLYVWDDAAGTRFVAVLDPRDFEAFNEEVLTNLARWTSAVTAGPETGRDASPTRSTPEGGVFLFQSHAQLTAYGNEGHGEVYRYEVAAPTGEQLTCVSCDPTGAPSSADAMLQIFAGQITRSTTLIPNVTDDGERAFFQSPDRLVPEDANDAQDVYEWTRRSAGTCVRAGGCLDLISSGQGEEASYLFGMSANGHDVFFETPDKLVDADIADSPSLYDAREEGGIPSPPIPEVCHGDDCQGSGSPSPTLSGTGSANLRNGNIAGSGKRCPKGKRKVRRHGKVRCIRKHRKHRRHRAGSNRGVRR
jgi:hypothetical protein